MCIVWQTWRWWWHDFIRQVPIWQLYWHADHRNRVSTDVGHEFAHGMSIFASSSSLRARGVIPEPASLVCLLEPRTRVYGSDRRTRGSLPWTALLLCPTDRTTTEVCNVRSHAVCIEAGITLPTDTILRPVWTSDKVFSANCPSVPVFEAAFLSKVTVPSLPVITGQQHSIFLRT